MPVSSLQALQTLQRADSPPPKRCKLCQESGHSVEEGQGPVSWRIPLDQDLLDTLAAIYPDWFKEKERPERPAAMAEARPQHSPPGPHGPPGPPGGPSPHPPQSPHGPNGPVPSPPKAEVDDTPLHKAMDRNKESLKVKLMLRRPYTQLVAQGIMPPLKTPPAFHEQRKQLERAKTGDLLKAKIQQRPDRQELVRQHILEADMDHVDPSLAERQRMLKKCRLADSLNDQLAHRPGPLELIQKNILHADEPIERAVKEGVIPFKATCEGQKTKPQHPQRYIAMDEDSQSSGEGSVLSRPPSPPCASSSAPTSAALVALPPASLPPATPLPATAATALLVPRRLSAGSDVIETAAASAGIVTLALSIPASPGGVHAAHGALVVASPSGAQVLQQQLQPQPVASRPPSAAPAPASLQAICTPVAPAPSPMSFGSSTSTSSLSPLSTLSSVSSPPSCSVPSPITPRPAPQPSPSPGLGPHAGLGLPAVSLSQQDALRSGAPGKDKNRKKSKSKTQPKTRTIKFHEYKGPPNAHKSSVLSSSPVETSYELLLQQQQLLLQCQLDWLHKYPQIILPAAQKPQSNSEGSSNASSNSLGTNVSVSQTQTTAPSVSPISTSGAQLGLITVTSSLPNAATGVTVNSLGNTAGTLLGVGNGNGTLVLTAQPSPSPIQTAVATVMPAPTPQTITVTLPAQQQQQAQVTLQPSLQVAQPPPEPLSTPTNISAPTPPLPPTNPQVPTNIKILGKLEDMKVSDLKMELKKRNLPVSGSKPQLIERIRNADAAAVVAATDSNCTVSNASSSEGNQGGQPNEIQMDITMDTSHTSAEDSLTGFSADIPSQPSPIQPPSVAPTTVPDSASSPNSTLQMSPVSSPTAPSPSNSVHDMDTTPVSPSPSPVTREDLIREQQRQIKELQKQVKLLQSQQQLELLRAKESSNQKPITRPSAAATIISANGTNGVSASTLDPSKAAVKQHLQNKIHQQQQQQLQVQQLQQQLQQQQLQQQQLAFQQQSINAKASLAAFLQQQQASSPSNHSSNINNNNNNNNTVSNNNNNSLNNLNNNILNKKLSKTLVVQPQLQQVQPTQQPQQQQQAAAAAAIVLNHINSQGKKGLASLASLAGITGANASHQRTNSLPNFLASMVQFASPPEQKSPPSHQPRASSVTPMSGSDDVDMKPAILSTHRLVLTRTTTEPHILTLTTAPAAASSAASGAATIVTSTNGVVPVSLSEGVTFNVTPSNSNKLPHYQEVASLLKNMKQEQTSEKSNSGRHSVKSQIVDDVLDILIKSGELPPSAAQDPTTPTSTGTNPGQDAASTNSSGLCGVFNDTQDNASIFTNVFSPENAGAPEHSSASVQCAPSTSPPPPPPPPPLPHTSFAITLPTALSQTNSSNIPPNENSLSLFGGNGTLDYILGSSGPPATSVDLKELGLDLETLDSMDFSQLDASAGVQDIKLEPSDVNMDAESEGVQLVQSSGERREGQHEKHQQQLAEQLLSTPSELMDICDMSEMDSDWLDSLIAPNDSSNGEQSSSFIQTSILTSPSSSSFIHMNGHGQMDSYDPLLSTNQDPLDLFNMDTMDSDFKMPSELGLTMNWDKVDFAT